MTVGLEAVAGSFRDPSGHVYELGDRIIRTVTSCAVEDYEALRNCQTLQRLAVEGRVIASEEVDRSSLGELGESACYALEHPKLPIISYPYEWPFEALKAAALAHLDLQTTLLQEDVVLSDASAYNVQFLGVKPIFIDYLSFRRYQDGEYWAGHRQFCEQFLNPLLLRSLFGISHNAWFRGSLEGITSADLSRLLRLGQKLSLNVFMHVVLPARLQNSAAKRQDNSRKAATQRRLPKTAYISMLQQLRNWIVKLKPNDKTSTTWSHYDHDNNYTDADAVAKCGFVSEFVGATKPDILWDLGCNTGEYSELALNAGCGRVVGFDFDQQALDQAFQRALARDLKFTPLFLDAANPSPNQGWNGTERYALGCRANADAVIALAFIHHLAIGRNIPLSQVVQWLLELAPRGVVEFVPKSDPQVRRMLALRQDIFPDYEESNFLSSIEARRRIVKSERLKADGRLLVWFDHD